MNRRSILKLLGAAPVAAPMAASAAAAGLSPQVGGAIGQMAFAQADRYSGSAECAPTSMGPSYWKDRLQDLIAKRGDRRASYMRRISKLDPDLAESRSLSLSAKIRLQAERDEQRDYEEEAGRFGRYIADFGKNTLGF